MTRPLSTAALGSRTFDVVVDQVCYTPVQAAIAARAFAGRTRRYVMTSTIEVYDPATAALPAVPACTPVPEESVNPQAWLVAMDLPWHDEAYLEAHYAEGKRQAEAVFTRAGSFAFASVRSAHVLGGGRQEFTGRLAHYAERIAQGEEITVHAKALPTVVHPLRGTGGPAAVDGYRRPTSRVQSTLAPTACSTYATLPRLSPYRPDREPAYRVVAAGETASPFSFDRHYAMSNARAKKLVFSFSRTIDWLPGAVAEALDATAAPAA